MKFGIDKGHNVAADTGAVGIKREDEVIRAVGNKVIEYLIKLGHTVVDCTPITASTLMESLSYRVTKANNEEVDYFVSIHLNAGGGRGTEVYAISEKGRLMAQGVLKEMTALGFVNRGIKNGSGLYVLKNTTAPAILIEVAFVDSGEDMTRLDIIGTDMVAAAITKGITGQDVTIEKLKNPSIRYQAHIQNNGWQNWQNNGGVAGTEGQSLRMEALAVVMDSNRGSIIVEGHIKNIGWQAQRGNGEIIGTVGRELQLEAIKIKLVDLEEFSIFYQVHVQNIGWSNWQRDGAIAGTVGQSLMLEAIRIKIEKK
jgi:hypothetical protein